jgi:hypothetical protein
MINVLDINNYCDDKFVTSDELNKLCQIFSNVEELQCCIYGTDVFLFILNHLPKLKNFKVKFAYNSFQYISSWLKMTALKLNINCIFL